MIVTCEHRLFLATCGMKQKPEIPHVFAPQTFLRESLRHSHFAIMWLVCSTERKQTTNTKGKECGSDVSSRFFGGSVAWHPKKRLRRRLQYRMLRFKIPKYCMKKSSILQYHKPQCPPRVRIDIFISTVCLIELFVSKCDQHLKFLLQCKQNKNKQTTRIHQRTCMQNLPYQLKGIP